MQQKDSSNTSSMNVCKYCNQKELQDVDLSLWKLTIMLYKRWIEPLERWVKENGEHRQLANREIPKCTYFPSPYPDPNLYECDLISATEAFVDESHAGYLFFKVEDKEEYKDDKEAERLADEDIRQIEENQELDEETKEQLKKVHYESRVRLNEADKDTLVAVQFQCSEQVPNLSYRGYTFKFGHTLEEVVPKEWFELYGTEYLMLDSDQVKQHTNWLAYKKVKQLERDTAIYQIIGWNETSYSLFITAKNAKILDKSAIHKLNKLNQELTQ